MTFPLMFAMQEMSARIGIVTSKGLISNIKDHYHVSVVYFTIIFCIPAIVLNIAADLSAMGAATHLIIPSIPSMVFCVFYSSIILLILIFLNYKKIAKILKYTCIILFLYITIPFLVKIDWKAVIYHTFVPTIHFNKEYISILIAILGTTISPYLFFWQATMEAEEQRNSKTNSYASLLNKKINNMRWDVGLGMFISNLVMYFIILTTGSILFKNGITNIETVEQAAKALEPLAGKFCYLLFSIGIVGTGLLAIPVFSSCVSYLITSSYDWEEGLNKKFHQAKIFYLIIIFSILLGLLIDLLKISPIKALIYTAMLYGICSPPIILIIIIICNNKKIMGKSINGKGANLFGGLTFLLMSAASILFFYFNI